jgi:hypothetical protein
MLVTAAGRFGTYSLMLSGGPDRISSIRKLTEDVMLMKLSLTKGRTKWVDPNEARELQMQGQVICVLDIKNEELAEFPTFCSISNDYRVSCVSLPY